MIAAVLAIAALSVGPVVLRGSSEPDPRRILAIDERGVTLEPSSHQSDLLGWERIKLVLGEESSRAEPFMPLADAAWRAEMRLNRGDLALAGPLFEEIFRRTRHTSGPTALLAAAGAARCRIERGDAEGAVIPWLIALALHSDGFRLAPRTALSIRMEDSGLLPDLPPLFVRGPALDALLDEWPGTAPQEEEAGESPAARLTALYRLSAVFTASGQSSGVSLPITVDAASPMERMIESMVRSFTDPDPEKRRSHREILIELLPSCTDTWREAWVRAALGRSFLRESDPSLRERGILELLHLPARFAGDQPFLAALALDDALAECRARGDDRSASIVESLLKALDPRHPGLHRTAATQSPSGASAP